MNRPRLLSSTLFLASALGTGAAHALPSTTALAPPANLTLGTEPTIDLGDYDPNPAPHTSYGIVKAPVAAIQRVILPLSPLPSREQWMERAKAENAPFTGLQT